jgi:hypothetical protein
MDVPLGNVISAQTTEYDESPNNFLVIETNNESQATGYKCDYHVGNGAITDANGVEINSFYEMVFPCSESAEQASEIIALELLQRLGLMFGLLPSGSTCTIPNTLLDVWVIGESSSPEDSIVRDMECTKLSVDGDNTTCCAVVEAPMTFWVSNADFQDIHIMKYVASEFGSDLSYQTAYIGSVLELTGDEGHGSISPPSVPDNTAVAGINEEQTTTSMNNSITILGGFFMAALVAVFLVGVAVAYRRRRSRHEVFLEELASGKKPKLSIDEQDGSEELTITIDVMSDAIPPGIFPRINSYALEDLPVVADEDDKQNPFNEDNKQNVTVDIGTYMKSYIMGQYGRHSNFGPGPGLKAPNNVDEPYDSEVDSWAQTDGTVGSLEELTDEI